MKIDDLLRKAMKDSGKSLYLIAKESKIPYPTILRFSRKERSLHIDSLDKLLPVIGLEITPVKKGK
jgi:hypothetical protein